MRPGPTKGFADALVAAWGALGLAQPPGAYPRWAVFSFWAGGEEGLRAALGADDAGREAVLAARRLGGLEAARSILESLVEAGSRHPGG